MEKQTSVKPTEQKFFVEMTAKELKKANKLGLKLKTVALKYERI